MVNKPHMKIRKYTRKNADNKYSYATAYHYAGPPPTRCIIAGNKPLTSEGILLLMIPEIAFFPQFTDSRAICV